jgi:hypothetical protein
MNRRPFSDLFARSGTALAGLGILVYTAIGLAACGGNQEATKRQLQKLQDEVRRVQNTADRLEERLAALELRNVPGVATEARKSDEAQPIYRPRLKVIHMAPGDPETTTGRAADAATNESQNRETLPTDRPVIQSRGR